MAILTKAAFVLECEDDFTDASGNGNTFTNVGSVGFATGKVGAKAANFAGGSRRITLADSAAISATTQWTLSLWIYGGGSIAGFAGKGVSGNGGFGLVWWGDGDLRFYPFTGGDFSVHADASGASSASTWYCVQVRYDGTQGSNATRLRMRINGTDQTLAFTGTIPSSLPDNTDDFEFGRSLAGSGVGSFGGKIDQGAFFSNEILSDEELDTIYADGDGLAAASWDSGGSVTRPSLLTLLGVS